MDEILKKLKPYNVELTFQIKDFYRATLVKGNKSYYSMITAWIGYTFEELMDNINDSLNNRWSDIEHLIKD